MTKKDEIFIVHHILGDKFMYKIKQLKKEDIISIIDFVYHLSIDNKTASYSRMRTKDKIENELIRRTENPKSNLFGVYSDEEIVGVCAYYWLKEDNYIQTTIFVFDRPTKKILFESINYIKQNRERYRLLIGIPAENKSLAELLKQLGKQIEHSANLIYDKNEIKQKCTKNIIEVNANNFIVYHAYHNKYALKHEMYWSSENLLKAINRFRIFCYLKDDVIIASIFYSRGNKHQEIFGLFSHSNERNIYKLLLNQVLKQIESESEKVEVTYFVDMNEGVELAAAKEVGFRRQDTYMF